MEPARIKRAPRTSLFHFRRTLILVNIATTFWWLLGPPGCPRTPQKLTGAIYGLDKIHTKSFLSSLPSDCVEIGPQNLIFCRWSHTKTHRHIDTQTHKHTDRHAHRHRHTDTQTHRSTDTPTHRHTHTPTHRHPETKTHRHTDTSTHGHTDTPTHSHIDISVYPIGCCHQLAHYSTDQAITLNNYSARHRQRFKFPLGEFCFQRRS